MKILKKAPLPLLVSMALRYRHDYGMRRDHHEMFGSGMTDEERKDLLEQLQQLHADFMQYATPIDEVFVEVPNQLTPEQVQTHVSKPFCEITIRQLYEEFSGNGFYDYAGARDEFYRALAPTS